MFSRFTTRYQQWLWPTERNKKEEIDDNSKGKMPRHTPKMLQFCHLLRQQLLEVLLALVHRSRHRGHRGEAFAEGALRTDDLVVRRGRPVLPESCTIEGRILVRSPRHYPSHRWTVRVRVERGGTVPWEIISYCPAHGSYIRDEGEATVAAPHIFGVASLRRSVTRRRSPLPTYSSIRC